MANLERYHFNWSCSPPSPTPPRNNGLKAPLSSGRVEKKSNRPFWTPNFCSSKSKLEELLVGNNESRTEGGRTDGTITGPPLPGDMPPANTGVLSPASARLTTATLVMCGTKLMPRPSCRLIDGLLVNIAVLHIANNATGGRYTGPEPPRSRPFGLTRPPRGTPGVEDAPPHPLGPGVTLPHSWALNASRTGRFGVSLDGSAMVSRG